MTLLLTATRSLDGAPTAGRSGAYRRSLAPLLFLAATLGGCAAGRTATTSEADVALRTIEAGYRATPDMAIEGSVKVSGLGVTVWVDALVRARDSMKITLTGPFAMPLGAMSATREAFEFYKADEDIVLLGTPDRATFGKLLMLPLDYDELVALLRGEIPRVPGPDEYEVRAEGGLLYFTVRRPAQLEHLIVDPASAIVTGYTRSRIVDGAAVPELSITYSQFATFGGRQLARRASVEINGGTQRLSVSIDEVDATIPADASLALDIDPGVERQRYRP